MQMRDTGDGLEVWAPAKLNLFLEVLAKRDDGFHEIETLMCPIRLYDTLYFRPDGSGRVTLACQGTYGPREQAGCEQETLPEGTENIVLRAIELLRERTGARSGAAVRLVKRIPMAAGLAGGSSDAAAAVLAANQGWDLRLSPLELRQLAAELGSDVPFFLCGGSAVCRGRGERIEPVAGLGRLDFVVVKPPAGLRTADVYRACRPAQPPRRADALIEALRKGQTALAGTLLHNQLQPAAETLSEWIDRLKQEFDRLGVPGHQMSGSGSSYFALCRNALQARRVARQLSARGVGRVFAVANCETNQSLSNI